MAVIRIKDFGGLIPQRLPRDLPDSAAQKAQDISPDSRGFRPSKDDATTIAASGVNNPLGIYRMQRNADGSLNTVPTTLATWKIDAANVSYAKTQINGDTLERTIKTYDDGSAAPQMIDAAGGARRLGVPQPANRPEITVLTVDEYTDAEKAGNVADALLYVKNISRATATAVWQAADRPGTTTSGYIDRTGLAGFTWDDAQQLRVFRLSSTGGANTGGISSTYGSASTDSMQWIFNPSLGGFHATSTAAWPTAWSGLNNDHFCIPFHAYGRTYAVDTVALSNYLAGMDKPYSPAGTKLLTAAQVTAIMQMVSDLSTATNNAALPIYNSLKAGAGQMKVLLGSASAAQVSASFSSFYAQASITTLRDTAIANFAEAVWNEALQAHNFVPYTDYTGSGQ